MAVNRYAGPCAVCTNRVPANGGKLVRPGRRWQPVHLACESMGTDEAVSMVYGITLNSGVQLTVNRNGRCEDAPCCGCCS